MLTNVSDDEIIIDLMNTRQNLSVAQMKHLIRTASPLAYAIEVFRFRLLNELARRDGNTLASKTLGHYCQMLRTGLSYRGGTHVQDDRFVKRYMGLYYNAGKHGPIPGLLALERDKLNNFSYDYSQLEGVV